MDDVAGGRLARMIREQAALRRVAVLVASGAPPEEVFQSVTEEAGKLLGATSAGMIRYEDSRRRARVVGRWHGTDPHGLERGSVVDIEGDTGVSQVLRAMRPVRIRDFEGRPGFVAQEMFRLGFRETVAAPITVSGQLWGAVIVATAREEPLPEGTEEHLVELADLAGLALAGAAAREELIASRARIVAAADAARKKLERDLHDGAQQRIVSTALTLKTASAKLDADPATAGKLIQSARRELELALEELRELARGLHPAALTERGLEPALQLLAERAPFPVEVAVTLPGRVDIPSGVQAAAYYLVSEALTNVAKYADASHARVSVESSESALKVEVSDDGRGGAVPAPGSGLSGLADRIEALAGTIEIDSPPGKGTRLSARLPLAR
jgi:signal transduction histidine kinase